MKIERRFTRAGKGPYEGIRWERRVSEIRNPDGRVVFQHGRRHRSFHLEPDSHRHHRPESTSARPGSPSAGSAPGEPVSRRISGPRRALPQARIGARRPAGIPPPGVYLAALGPESGFSIPKRTTRPSTTRPATCWPGRWRRRTAPSGSTPACTPSTTSKGRPRATSTSIPQSGEVVDSTSAYERPQPHACFILNIEDDLVNDGGIMDLVDAGSPALQVRIRHGLQFLQDPRLATSRCPAAAYPAGSCRSSR